MIYPATDLIDAVVWPGRITKTGKRVSGFIYDRRYQYIIERLAIWNEKDGYHPFRLPDWLILQVGRPYLNSNQCLIHKLIFRLQWNRWPNGQVDHIHGKQDNRSSSLRLITNAGNQRNRQKIKNSGLPWGVSYYAPSKKYRARYCDSTGKSKHLGYFSDVTAAAAAVDAANTDLLAEDAKRSDLMNRGLLDPRRRSTPRGVVRRGEQYSSHIKKGSHAIYLGKFHSALPASAAYEAARVVRGAGGTVEEMKQAAREAVAACLRKERDD